MGFIDFLILKNGSWIVNFFRKEGFNLVAKLKAMKHMKWKTVWIFLKNQDFIWWVVLMFFLLLSLGVHTGVLNLLRQPSESFPVRLYLAMLRRLAKIGFIKQSGWTSRDFLNHLIPLNPEKRILVQNITRHYE